MPLCWVAVTSTTSRMYDTEVVEVALAALGGAPHPAKALLKARLAAARG